MLYSSLAEMLIAWPQRNKIWKALDTCFVADASDLGLKPGETPSYRRNITDPWHRHFRNPSMPITNDDGEITVWVFTTTVEGDPVECRIFND